MEKYMPLQIEAILCTHRVGWNTSAAIRGLSNGLSRADAQNDKQLPISDTQVSARIKLR